MASNLSQLVERAGSGQRSKPLPKVLVVDDDTFNRTLFDKTLRSEGYETSAVESVAKARRLLTRAGVAAFACVLTDYHMPGETGIDLLKWLQAQKDAPATIVITADEEREVIRYSLRGGAVDFLEKPVSRQDLCRAIERAVQETHRLRKLRESREQVDEAVQINHLFQHVGQGMLGRQVRLAFHPKHEVGGDFINVLPKPGNDSGTVLLLGDVSGHDLRAGFVSAYFQGMARGLLMRETPLEQVIAQFNTTLAREWQVDSVKTGQRLAVGTSLALCAAEVNPQQGELRVVHCGFPSLWLLNRAGQVVRSGRGNPTLGWFEDWTFAAQTFALNKWDRLYVCTDGLHEYAAHQGVSVVAIADYLLRLSDDARAETLEKAQDDILVMSFDFDAAQAGATSAWRPVLGEQYAGNEAESIDRFQNIWRRSLQFALPKTAEDRLYDFLLCCREAVLNGLVHGCEGSADKIVDFSVSYNEETRVLIGRVADPGHGHSFDIEHRIDRLPRLEGAQLGLTIIRQLSDRAEIANNGSTVIFEFDLG
ncbi:MAG: SpoIIE family protein phosphatase [Opitutales bacterium]